MNSPLLVAVAHHLWQSTLFAVAVGALTLLFRRNSASVRHALWLVASLKFLVPFALLSALGARIQAGIPWQFGPHGVGGVAASSSFVSPFISVLDGVAAPLKSSSVVAPAAVSPDYGGVAFVIAAAWVLGSLSLTIFWFMRWRGIQRALRVSRAVDFPFPIPIRVSDTFLEPGIVGVLRPVLMLPLGIERRLTPAQLRAVLAHEQCHVQRRDNLSAALHMLVEVLFWFHPLVWWLGARLVAEREQACDEHVVRAGHESGTYAEGILNVCQHYLESRLPVVAGVSGADLRKRIEDIMKNSQIAGLGALKKSLLALATCGVLVIPVAVGMIGSPVARAEAASQVAMAAASSEDKFVAARIRLTPPGTQMSSFSIDPSTNALMIGNQTLHQLIEFAYKVDKAQVTGPAWLETVRLDLRAKAPRANESGRPDQAQLVDHAKMMRALLEEKFGLVLKRSTSDRPVLVLKVDDGGPKLEPVPVGFDSYFDFKPNALFARGMPVSVLNPLGARIGATIVDETGLKGTYALSLVWGPVSGPTEPPIEQPAKLTQRMLQDALEDQLGLRLEPRTAALEMLEVVSVKKPEEFVTGELPVPVAYESVSIQLAPPDAKGEAVGFDPEANRFLSRNRPLRSLVAMAYGIDEHRVRGGEWLDNPRLDVVAVAGPTWSEGNDMVREHASMMRTVLEKQFGVVVARGRPDTDAYVLSIAPGGAKLPAAAVGAHPTYDFNKNGFTVKGESMMWLSTMLSRMVNASVVDQTALAGSYDLNLAWGPKVSFTDATPAAKVTPQKLDELLEASMGLRLEARRMPIEQLTVLRVKPLEQVVTAGALASR